MKNHQKHAKLERPETGDFGRNEWAIVGAPCSDIKALALQLGTMLAAQLKIAYVDADHKSPDEEGKAKSPSANGFFMEFTDKIGYTRIDSLEQADNIFYRRAAFNQMDIVLVNGNHFTAKRQIVIIDPRKEASLLKRVEQLTQVDLILLAEGQTQVFPFLQAALDNAKHSPLILQMSQINEITNWILSSWQKNIPPLFGLVLAGGKSVRMGQDKGELVYHQKPQREHIADLLAKHTQQVFVSCRPDQKTSIKSSYPLLEDTFAGLGPYGAILSALQLYPNSAWLVVACDLPFMSEQSLMQLCSMRNPSALATAFQSPVDQWPEPLAAIWEPKSYAILLQFLSQGYSCPRKVLINSHCNIVHSANPEALFNANEPDDFEAAKNKLNNV